MEHGKNVRLNVGGYLAYSVYCFDDLNCFTIVIVLKYNFVPWPVWLSWLECNPMYQKVVGSISGQGTCLGCGFNP